MDLVQEAGYELALIAKAVALQLDLMGRPVEVAPVGNALLRNKLLRQAFVTSLENLMPESSVVEPCHNSAIGSLLLAFIHAGFKLDDVKAHLSIFEPKKSVKNFIQRGD